MRRSTHKTPHLCTATFKLCLITGASSGIGKALCFKVAERGIPLWITGQNSEALQTLVHTLPTSVQWVALDLCNPDARAKLLEQIRLLSPDLIFNCAGIGLYGPALMHSLEEEMRILTLNASAAIEISLEAARTLIQQKKSGAILNISSAAAFFPYPTFSLYAASKACLKQFSLAFDKEISSLGVRCLTSCPGQIDTPFRERAAKGFPQKRSRYLPSAKDAAERMFQQVEKGKTLDVFPLPYKLAVFLGRFFPEPWIEFFLKKALRKRFNLGL